MLNVNEEILLLLGHVRSSLSESISSLPMTRNQKKKIQDAILNKATDYQILEMVIGGIVTSNKSNIARELVLHETFTRRASRILLQAGVGKEFAEAIRNSLPLRFYKMSSRLSEAKEYLKGKKKIPYVSLQEASKIKTQTKQKLIKALISESRSVLDPLKEKELLGKAKMLLEADFVDPWLALSDPAAYTREVARLNAAKAAAKKPVAPGLSGEGPNTALDTIGEVPTDTALDTMGEVPSAASALMNKVGGAAQSAYNTAQGAAQSAYDTMRGLVDKAQGQLGPVQKWIETNPALAGGIGAAALAGTLLYAGTKIYRRFFSQAARACRGQRGKAFDACVRKYKSQAIQAEIKQLQSSARLCSKTRNPQKCNMEIQKKIAKLRAKLQKTMSESVQKNFRK